jgi:hypothetical protein
MALFQCPFGGVLMRAVVDDDMHAFAPRDMTHDVRVDPRNRLEPAGPILAIVRPGNPGRFVALPLCRHTIAEFGGSRWFGDSLYGHIQKTNPQSDTEEGRNRTEFFFSTVRSVVNLGFL